MEEAKKTVPEGWFKWERPGIDFPFYNDDSVPAWHAWLLIGVTLLVAVVMNVTTFLQVGGTAFKAFLVFLLPLAALVFFTTVFARDTLDRLPDMAERGFGWGWEGWKNAEKLSSETAHGRRRNSQSGR